MRKSNLTKLVKGTACLLCMFLLTGCGDSDSSDRESDRDRKTETNHEKEEEEIKLTAEELFMQYLADDLIPTHGLSESSQQGEKKLWEDPWLEPAGILSAYIGNLDEDEEEELLVARIAEMDSEGDCDLNLEIYEVENEQVVLGGDMQMDGRISWTEYSPYCQNSHVNVVETEEGIFILAEEYRYGGAFGDGVVENYWVMTYGENGLQTISSFEQTAGGSSDFAYTGYLYENNEVISEEVLYSEPYLYYEDYEGEAPKYEDYDIALAEWFGTYGIKVKPDMYGNYGHSASSIFSNDNDIAKVMDYIIEFDSGNYDSDTVTYLYKANMTDYTELKERYETYQSEPVSDEKNNGEATSENDAEDVAKEDVWQDAYKEFLASYNAGGGEEADTFRLANIDRDDVPELLIRSGEFHSQAQYVDVYTYYNEEVVCLGEFKCVENLGEWCTFLYYPGENLLCNASYTYSVIDYAKYEYYQIENGSVQPVQTFVMDVDDTGENPEYKIDDQVVSEEQYKEALEKINSKEIALECDDFFEFNGLNIEQEIENYVME